MSKRKNVRFVEDAEVSDRTLLRMSKRRRGDEAEVDALGGDVAYGEIGHRLEPRASDKTRTDESKHTLDSDEEEEDKYARLNVADVEGQEESTIDFDEETKITPFNMTEEMDEGHFDSDGTFIFNKKNEMIKDAWLDNIDWGKVKKDAGDQWKGENNEDTNDSSEPQSILDRCQIYEEILQLLNPRETITKALKRLGGTVAANDVRKRRWEEKKKQKQAEEAEAAKNSEKSEQSEKAEETVQVEKTLTPVEKLTGLADQLVSDGEFEVYGYTYEKISHEVEKLRNEKEKSIASTADIFKPSGSADSGDDALDMFADDIDTSRLGKKDIRAEQKDNEKKDESDPASATSASDQVAWEFKWENKDEAPLYGPYSSQQMQQWSDDNYFKDGVWVRRQGQENAVFYNSKRVDFELYL